MIEQLARQLTPPNAAACIAAEILEAVREAHGLPARPLILPLPPLNRKLK